MSRARDLADRVLHNRTHEDTDGGRESIVTFKGEQSGGEISTLAQIQASHDGTSDDQKADLIFKTNDGSDGTSPTEAMRINSDQNISIPDNGKVMFGTGDDLQIYHDATNSIISNATGDLSFDLAGDFIIDVDGGDVKFKDDGTEFSQYYKDGNDLAIYSSISDGDIKFQGKDGGSVITPVTIDMSEGGYVGIGLTAPTAPLTVKSPSNAEAIHIVGRSDDIGQIKFYEADHTTILATIEARNSFVNLGSVANVPLTFMTNGSERMRLTQNYALFGMTTNDSQGVQLYTNGANGIWAKCTGTVNYWITRAGQGAGNGSIATIYSDTASVGSITVTSSSTAYNTSSDYRLKENVTNVTDGITRVKQLAPKRFNFIADADTTVDGFVAHEAQAVVPEAVHGTKDEVDDDGNAVMQGIDQSKLVPLLTAALQEAIAKIETLETENTAIKARLDALEAE